MAKAPGGAGNYVRALKILVFKFGFVHEQTFGDQWVDNIVHANVTKAR